MTVVKWQPLSGGTISIEMWKLLVELDQSIPKSTRRSLKLSDEDHFPVSTINPKTEPPSFTKYNALHVDKESKRNCNNLLVLWKSVRYLCSAD